MGARDIAGDGKSQPDAAGLQIAAFIQAMEGTERFLALVRRDARPVIVDMDFGKARSRVAATRAPACRA